MKRTVGFIALCAVLLSPSAHGAFVSYTFAGSVRGVFGGSFYGITPQFGDSVVGFFSYETSILDSDTESVLGTYIQPSTSHLGFTIRGITMQSDAGYTATVQNNAGIYDTLQLFDNDFTINVNGVPNSNNSVIKFRLDDVTGTVFSNTELPGTLSLDAFRGSSLYVNGQGQISTVFNGVVRGAAFNITSLTAVPEPGVLSLFATSSISYWVWMLRRKRNHVATSRNMPQPPGQSVRENGFLHRTEDERSL